MIPYSPEHGENRSHYAGFFDNCFKGRAVAEIRAGGVSLVMLANGQIIAIMRFERLGGVSEKAYGKNGNNYQDQQLKHSKYFGKPRSHRKRKTAA
jgi:deoxycytidine triphosphate deaminase